MRGLLAIIYTTNTSRGIIPCYMSQAKNITPELMIEEETISAAMKWPNQIGLRLRSRRCGQQNIVSWIKSKGISGGKLIAVITLMRYI
jgi:hypothetical protein